MKTLKSYWSNANAIIFSALLILILTQHNAISQESQETIDFSYGERLFREGFYDLALIQFESFVADYPSSPNASDALFQMGECYKKMKEYAKAVEAFEKVIKKYPESSLGDKARYQIAICSLMASQPSEYEQSSTDRAIKKFKDFIDEAPPEDLAEEAQKAIARLEDKKAKHEYEIAQYYESRRRYDSAVIYYRSVIINYPGTEWAEMAKEDLKKAKEKQKK